MKQWIFDDTEVERREKPMSLSLVAKEIVDEAESTLMKVLGSDDLDAVNAALENTIGKPVCCKKLLLLEKLKAKLESSNRLRDSMKGPDIIPPEGRRRLSFRYVMEEVLALRKRGCFGRGGAGNQEVPRRRTGSLYLKRLLARAAGFLSVYVCCLAPVLLCLFRSFSSLWRVDFGLARRELHEKFLPISIRGLMMYC